MMTHFQVDVYVSPSIPLSKALLIPCWSCFHHPQPHILASTSDSYLSEAPEQWCWHRRGRKLNNVVGKLVLDCGWLCGELDHQRSLKRLPRVLRVWQGEVFFILLCEWELSSRVPGIFLRYETMSVKKGPAFCRLSGDPSSSLTIHKGFCVHRK